MATKINPHGIVRETAMDYRGRPLIVELHPKYMTVKQKGCREAVVASYDAIYEMAMKIQARGGQ